MAEYEIQFSSPGDDAWVSGTHSFPSSVKLEATGLKGAPDVSVAFEMRDGVPEVVDLRITAKPTGRAVRSTDLDTFMPFEGLALNAFRQFSIKVDGQRGFGPTDEREFWAVGGSLRSAQDSRRGPSLAELEDVARIYREAVDGRPTEAVQIRGSYASRRTAARRIQQAREAGLLPPTTPGKKKA